MRAYLFDNQPASEACRNVLDAGIRRANRILQGDQRLPHDSGKELGKEDLSQLGVLYYHIDDIAGVDKLAVERGYKNRDEIYVSPEKMGAVYESKVKMFFDEHLHEDEEIRYIRGGQGFFDVRNRGDQWIRIQLMKVAILSREPAKPYKDLES
jgi:1,2-dihydroxy-3-keto-5-methylthiopentene dioxygenase